VLRANISHMRPRNIKTIVRQLIIERHWEKAPLGGGCRNSPLSLKGVGVFDTVGEGAGRVNASAVEPAAV